MNYFFIHQNMPGQYKLRRTTTPKTSSSVADAITRTIGKRLIYREPIRKRGRPSKRSLARRRGVVASPSLSIDVSGASDSMTANGVHIFHSVPIPRIVSPVWDI